MARLLLCNLSLLSLIILQSSPNAAQKTSNISIGQSLTATSNGTSWHSPLDEFAFGFFKLPNSSNLFLLGIWYVTIPNTIVWWANYGYPVTQGSSVKITADEGLVLSDPRGTSLWSTSNELSGGSRVSYGFMNDTGNFFLKRSNDDNPVWQSFDHPTDTLLPGQSLGINGMINSRLSETNYSKGRFQYRLTSDGSMVLNTRDLKTGYTYEPYHVSDRNYAGQTQRYVYNESGYQYILRKDGSTYNMLPVYYTPSPDYYQRTTLSFDGVLIWYSAPKNSVTDVSIYQIVPSNICQGSAIANLGSGICGTNSICILGDDQRPKCTCAKGYSLEDPNDQYGTCKPDFKPQSCVTYAERSMKGEYTLVRLPDTDFVYNDYERLNSYNEADCENACLKDCFCAAASFQPYGSSSGCWKKKAPLSNGIETTDKTKTLWIKIGNANNSSDPNNPFDFFPPVAEKNKVNSQIKLLVCSSVSINLILPSVIGLGIIFIYQKKQLRVFNNGNWKTLRKKSHIPYFTYQELKEAMNGFKEELGRGSFGIVYKGLINEGGIPTCVAVKKLDRISSDTEKEFRTEINVIGRTHHKNLVQLVAFCEEGDQRLLVYEYMSNGSLADYLFGGLRPSWIDRTRIAQGIARGLLYLHEECSTQIIHCDIKPQNILLDENQNARICDFGLAKLLALDQSHTDTAIRGTKGYVAPDWFRNQPVTVKVDVYSFGVLLLEIICCRKSICMELIEKEAKILTDWAFDCYLSNRVDLLVNNDMEALNDIVQLERFVIVSLWCIQEDPSLRPTIPTVTQMLEGIAEVPKNPPCPTSFSITTQN